MKKERALFKYYENSISFFFLNRSFEYCIAANTIARSFIIFGATPVIAHDSSKTFNKFWHAGLFQNFQF